jgi:hypothetical protein
MAAAYMWASEVKTDSEYQITCVSETLPLISRLSREVKVTFAPRWLRVIKAGGRCKSFVLRKRVGISGKGGANVNHRIYCERLPC